MKSQIAKFLIAVLLITPLAACQSQEFRTPEITKQDGGTVLGGIGGALLGNQIGGGSGRVVATIAGGLLGAYLGNTIGASLDRADLAYYDKTSQGALEANRVGQTSTWSNPDSGNSGTITPTRTFQSASNQYCREYTQTIQVGGKTERAYGTACRQQDGSWKIVQ